MSKRAADALHVHAQGGAVRALYKRGMTWVSFRPMPDLTCCIDFAVRNFPTSAFYPVRCKVSVTNTLAGTAATAMTISAFT